MIIFPPPHAVPCVKSTLTSVHCLIHLCLGRGTHTHTHTHTHREMHNEPRDARQRREEIRSLLAGTVWIMETPKRELHWSNTVLMNYTGRGFYFLLHTHPGVDRLFFMPDRRLSLNNQLLTCVKIGSAITGFWDACCTLARPGNTSSGLHKRKREEKSLI